MIIGIAAIMLHSPDPAALARWYSGHLGIAMEPEEGAWHGEVLDPASRARTYFGILPLEQPQGTARRAFTITFRTDSLEAMLAALKQEGVIIDRLEKSEFGRVAYLRDLDGNPIELWAESVPQGSPPHSGFGTEGV